MHALSCVLALSLALGPAAASNDAQTEPAPNDAQAEPAPALPDVDDEPATSEPTTEPAPSEPEPAELEPPAPEVEAASVQPPAPAVEPPAADLVPAKHDRLGCDGSKSCRNMSIAGIVVGSLGVAGVGAGIGLLVNPDKVDPDLPINITSTHPPGLVSVTICSGFMLTSMLMLIAAHKGYKQGKPDDKAKRKRGRARVQPTAMGVRF